MDFDIYKHFLIDYLQKCGKEIKNENGLNCCFSPDHNDRNPSCQINDEHFHCYACGIDGDIYDAVGIIEGISDRKEQYLHLEKIYGGNYVPAPLPVIEKKTFEPDTKATDKVMSYLENHKARKSQILNFLKQRATISTKGKINNYPEDILDNLSSYFYYWPGTKTAKNDGLTTELLTKAGIYPEGKDRSSWYHSGVVLPLGKGFKLHYYNETKCEKRGSIGCCTFPMPGRIDELEAIVLVEGEIDAVVCNAAGFSNVFSTGGTQGLTKPKIKQYLLNTAVKEIIILYDNDTPGKKAAGLIPYENEDKKNTCLPVKLIQAGFNGTIKIASLNTYKDPDEAILHGRMDLVKDAIDNAMEYQTAKIEKAVDTAKKIERGLLSPKLIKKLLQLIPFNKVKKEDKQLFIDAILDSVQEENLYTVQTLLHDWGTDDVNHTHEIKPYILIDLANKYCLSNYYINKIKEGTITEEYISRKGNQSFIPSINYNDINKNDLYDFIYKRSEKAAASIIAKDRKDKLIYIETDDKYFVYNGLTWERMPDITGIAYETLRKVINDFKNNLENIDEYDNKAINMCLVKIGQYNFCKTIMKAVADKPEIFREQITFDGPAIQETLTLQDGVIDFSGTEIHYRDAKPQEYRFKKLPYYIDQVREKKEPKKFIDFMRGNFRNEGTFKTLMYYLSLLPSRKAQFKVGGIFVGVSNTGKTTTMNIIDKIYPDMIAPIPRDLIMATRYNNNSGPNPYLARLEGMGAGLSDETQRNDTLNSAMFKQLTGGGMLTARGMYANPRNFMPTAQIIILTNFSPKFDGKDQATINRMIIIPFNVQHNPDSKDTKSQEDLFKMLEPEFPLIVKLFAEYYIDLKNTYKSKIPLSSECEGYKQDYIENQETDLDRFVSANIEFIKNENIWVPLKDIYKRFAEFNDIALDEYGKPLDRDEWSQARFTRYFKGDYNEVRIKQKKLNGYPEQIVLNARLKDLGEEPKENKVQPQHVDEIPFDDSPGEEPPF